MKPHPGTLLFPIGASLLAPLPLGSPFARCADATTVPSLSRAAEPADPLPSAAERTALLARQRRFAANARDVSILIFPPLIREATDTECAVHLARLFGEAGLGAVCSVAEPLLLPRSADETNEVRALWDTARKFREHVRQHPPGADYALYADYAIPAADGPRGHVRLVVCDGRGEWVIVDVQTPHDADFQAVKPVTKADADRIVTRRLHDYLRRSGRLAGDAATAGG